MRFVASNSPPDPGFALGLIAVLSNVISVIDRPRNLMRTLFTTSLNPVLR
jgi:hypothetical protein